MKIIGYHLTKGIVANSLGETATSNFLVWLATQSEDSIKMFYSLDYSVAQLVKSLVFIKDEGTRLLDIGRLYFAPHQINYIPSRFLGIKYQFYKGAPYASFSDAKQYMESQEFPSNDPEDCIAKAKEAQVIGQQVYDTLEGIGLNPTKLTSPISVYQKEVLDNIDLPTIDDIPDQVAEYAYNCCHGGWIEVFRRGHWSKAYDYDIVSAYPYEVSQLLDIRLGKWENYPLFMSRAKYGFCKCRVNITSHFSPIIFSEDNRNYTPTGTWETYLTKREIEVINAYNLGKVEILDGWWWTPQEEKRPLEPYIKRLFHEKEARQGLSRTVVKRIMAGIWGKFLELRQGDMGPLFNPVWGAEVEVNTRLAVARLCLDNKIVPISIAVDGIVTTHPIPLESKTGMGCWKLNTVCPCLSINSSTVALQDKVNGTDFSLDYDWIIEQIESNPKATEFSIVKDSPVTLSKAVRQNKWDNLGELEESIRTIDLTYERKRIYKDSPKNGKELIENKYNSSPLDVSLVKALT